MFSLGRMPASRELVLLSKALPQHYRQPVCISVSKLAVGAGENTGENTGLHYYSNSSAAKFIHEKEHVQALDRTYP